MAAHRRTVIRAVVAATLVAALVTVGALSFAQASPRVTAPVVTPAVATGPTVADLFPAPAAPDLDIPSIPLPDPEPVTTADGSGSDHCGDVAWWNARQVGDPSDYVAACGVWPWWVDRGDTATDEGSGAAPYTGPTEGVPWSPEYGFFEGRTDGPKNSRGEPCMQGRDNDDPNC